MNLKLSAATAAIAVAMSGLTSGVGIVNAAPLDPLPPAPAFQPDPGGPPPAPGIPAEKCWRYGRTGAGNGQAGGGIPLYPPPCKGTY
jgi:hypothetical protein